MLKRILQIAFVAVIVTFQTGCLYMAFEKHGGAFLVSVTGEQFVHIPNDQWDSTNNAMVYFYRPDSRWASEEIDAPSVFIDDHRYVSLRANGFTWLEMAPGPKQITMRRPIGLLLGFEGIGSFSLSKIVDAEFDLEAGKVYYFRYSEIQAPSQPNPDLDPEDTLAQGDMQLVSRDVAIKEIVKTRFIENEPPFAKNSAGTSIVEQNKKDAYEKEKARLELAKEEELEQLKADGHWKSTKWYWPFGGGPTKRTEADIELKELEKERENYLLALAAEENKGKTKWWWPFGNKQQEEEPQQEAL
ncbi:DUF2846 domain-containing protein [Alkalimarinus alittae]|uniref:DUF2846 domain-containing protein n=1 Tax=Alkalimarinus alittae TaxID=2961619 RepID=A0ABY6N5P6_9ALTE|nr:DUF2846 domain-containing protein [Alkalimarinus alittae]UZE97443.1 DUF2846 domain-containing protein [Alkalimarinus alittae]